MCRKVLSCHSGVPYWLSITKKHRWQSAPIVGQSSWQRVKFLWNTRLMFSRSQSSLRQTPKGVTSYLGNKSIPANLSQCVSEWWHQSFGLDLAIWVPAVLQCVHGLTPLTSTTTIQGEHSLACRQLPVHICLSGCSIQMALNIHRNCSLRHPPVTFYWCKPREIHRWLLKRN